MQTLEQLALWGGIECTVNRVRDRYFDQLKQSGHDTRLADLDAVASLGIRKLRYPVLWENTCTQADVALADWRWADERLGHLQQLGIEPIAGLVHHGSGPKWTSLVDSGFAKGLETYAGAFAQRFPWVTDYTPVNEPLTTARFSALYGLWYPHECDSVMFARALVNQCAGVSLAMKAIRCVNPKARLIQTEDLGTVMSTPRLRYQAEFDNQRRWLSLDLLTGRVDKQHPFYSLLARATSEARLASFCESPCPPDVIGVNYYVTSDRFLDHRISNHAPHLHGGNGRDAYADIEAVRTKEGMRGHAATLQDAWDRYKIPLAITEVHLDCHREEQLRWLHEAWSSAVTSRGQGVDVRAVTLWSLFGAFDWNSLCTRSEGYYESGAFDLRCTPPRPTALARAAVALCKEGTFTHPTLNERGWWWRPARVRMPDSEAATRTACIVAEPTRLTLKRIDQSHPGRPLLIVGDGGKLTKAIQRECESRAIDHVLATHPIEFADGAPWAIVYAKAILSSDRKHAEWYAAQASRGGLPFLTFSSDISLATNCGGPCVETTKACPLDERSFELLVSESVVRTSCPSALVIRGCALFGLGWESPLALAAYALSQGNSINAGCDSLVTPSYLPDVARVALDLLIDEEQGIWHLVNSGSLSWTDAFRLLTEQLGQDPNLVRTNTDLQQQLNRLAGRALASCRGQLLPSIEDAIGRFSLELIAREQRPMHLLRKDVGL